MSDMRHAYDLLGNVLRCTVFDIRKRNVRNNYTDTIEAEWGCLQIYSKGK
jgi:hypothetical protein